MKNKGADLEDPSCWWEASFIDEVIAIENSQGKLFRVAVCLVNNWRLAQQTLKKIANSFKFQQLRIDLGIDQHWIIYTDAKAMPSIEAWCDLLYQQIDFDCYESSCMLIDM